MSNPNLTGLAAYAGDYQQDLLTRLYQVLDAQAAGITVIPNLKSKLQLHRLVVNAGLKPYTGKFISKDDISFSPRTLEVVKAQRDMEIEPSKYLATFMEHMRGLGENAKNMKIPFAE